jgi:excisionase family DNA binding protein
LLQVDRSKRIGPAVTSRAAVRELARRHARQPCWSRWSQPGNGDDVAHKGKLAGASANPAGAFCCLALGPVAPPYLKGGLSLRKSSQDKSAHQHPQARLVPLLDVSEAAQLLGIKPWTLRQWLSQRRISFIKVGRLTKLRHEGIAAFIEKNRQEARPF